MIENCPICDTKLEKKEGQVDHYCPNIHCPARKIESLIHFVDRHAMNIVGLGERIMEDFFNMKLITSIPDIYHLKEHREELVELEGFGNKSVDNLLLAIEDSKLNSLERLLFALGINEVGEKTAKVIARKYENIDNIMNASLEDLTKINDIGDIIAKSIYDFFKDEQNIEMINRLKELHLNMNYLGEKIVEKEAFKDKTFVITGTLINYTRDEVKHIIENNGGKTSDSVSKKTSVVIVGDNPGSKYDKAQQLGITIWHEEELEENLKD